MPCCVRHGETVIAILGDMLELGTGACYLQAGLAAQRGVEGLVAMGEMAPAHGAAPSRRACPRRSGRATIRGSGRLAKAMARPAMCIW